MQIKHSMKQKDWVGTESVLGRTKRVKKSWHVEI